MYKLDIDNDNNVKKIFVKFLFKCKISSFNDNAAEISNSI